MERESEEGSLNCNKPRARQNSLTHTHQHAHTQFIPVYSGSSRAAGRLNTPNVPSDICSFVASKCPESCQREPPHHKVHLVAVLERSVVSHDLQGHDGSVPSCRLIGDVQISIFSAPSEETPSANEGHMMQLKRHGAHLMDLVPTPFSQAP